MLKIFKGMLVTLLFVSSQSLLAQSPAVGVWEGKLEVAPGTTITILFDVSEAAGVYSAMLNSPDMGAIKDIKATSASFDGSKLDIKVDALNGAYSGTLNAGTFEGNWTQPGSTIPMNLQPYEAKVLSDASKELLMGQWSGKLMGPGITFNIVFHFELDEAGEFKGSLQNADAGPTKQPMENLSLDDDGTFKFQVGGGQVQYTGKLAGTAITGAIQQGPQNMVLNVEKGAYVEVLPDLALTDTDFETLSGTWSGNIEAGPQGTITMNLMVEKNAEGKIMLTLNVPQQNNSMLRITSATLAEGQLDFALNVPPASYSGSLEGNAITGKWSQGPNAIDLILTKQ